MDLPVRKPIEDAANPLGTDGFEFLEFTGPDVPRLSAVFEALGFTKIGAHRSKRVWLYRQGDANFILNAEPQSFAERFAADHGPSACAMAFRVRDAGDAFRRLMTMGATPFTLNRIGPMELNIPAIVGIGGAPLYLVDRRGELSIYDIDFLLEPIMPSTRGAGLYEVDHVTHNVERGRMDHWAHFYERYFNFREIRHFDMDGQHAGQRSRAMTGPCGKLRIPINESADDKSQIADYLREYRGEGIQHIALASSDIVRTVTQLKARGVPLLPPPPETYYEAMDARLPGHGLDQGLLKELGILVDGDRDGLRLQIFTEPVIGPIFFEIIERRGALKVS